MRSAADTTWTAEVVSAGRKYEAETAPVVNPARLGETVGTYALAGTRIVDEVVQNALAAGAVWGSLTGVERGRLMHTAADVLERDMVSRAELLTREQGKVLWESELDVGGAPRLLRYYADLAPAVDEEIVVRDERGTTVIRRRPMGPTVVIVPWNYPVYLCMMVLAPALAAGNPVIVKPSEFAPLALTKTLAMLASTLPDGVVNVVPGLGSEAGAALVSHPGVRKVLFTGGTETGREVLRGAAGNITSVSLELGGNDPAIVLDTAGLDDRLIREIRRSVYTCTGQVCFNIKRLYVQRGVYDEFVEKFRQAVDEIVVGDGLDPASTIGPLNNRRQFESVTALLQSTRKTGARVDVLGRRLDDTDWDNGYYLLPSVVTGIPHESALVSCEQFGPTVPVIPFDDIEDAVRMANDTEYGLAASVWSEDAEHALAVGRRIDAGSVFVNSHRVGSSDMTMPFGGMKRSGLGRNHGMWAIDECSELQALSHRPDTSAFPGPAVH
ncbi:aldehyde dehydrogenase family protein [Streptomyces spongiae]|uniref:aldehyde dehydrogenase family protein n=1 Tax=Streptomyces spongiae TaxID=565072 RepID=UPI00188463CC|nr:aldehyde dehydrogenase family protein [Streptomyces spongiae]